MLYYSKFYVPLLKRSFFIAKNEHGICYIDLQPVEKKFLGKLYDYLEYESIKNSPKKLAGEIKQIKEYFAGKRKVFSLSVFLKGSKFKTKAWLALSKVNYGNIISYSELAKRSGNKNAYRAAATACSSNPVPVIIPCHRVVSKDGSPGGYGGGLDMKLKMLKLEKVI